MSEGSRFTTFRNARRIWAIGAIHGESAILEELHAGLASRLEEGDRLVYLGNYLGYSPHVRETVDELLAFRSAFLALPPYADPNDIVYLRGSQEEIWQKILQLQFAQNPSEVLKWMLGHGGDATLRAYGGTAELGFECASEGALALTHWTSELRDRLRALPGHEALLNSLRRAALTENHALLFVNTGIDATRTLNEQTDSFWWAGRSFKSVEQPFDGFRRVVRGFDPDHGGFEERPHTITVDGGCGFGGKLTAACLSSDGELLGRLEF